jgi:isochorismate hydrolase
MKSLTPRRAAADTGGGAKLMNGQPETGNGLLRREDAVLLVIDVQERLLPAIANGEAVVANIVKLLRFAQIIELPVILTEQQKLGATVEAVRAEIPGVEPISKMEFGCFACSDFEEAVRGSGRNTLVLSGIEAHICVAQTALGAVPEYGVHVLSDAISSRSLDDKKVALKRMLQAGVTITSTEMLMYELLGQAGTDEFRAVLKLVKDE